jgi:iron complex transport system ATP-binding protein
MKLRFPGVTLCLDEDMLVLYSVQPLHCLSSAIVGGGSIEAHAIVNRHVDKAYDERNPFREMNRFAQRHGIERPFVGLMTAVRLAEAGAATLREGDLVVAAVITAGVRNATAAGMSLPCMKTLGTINVILLIDANLAPAAMVNAVITVTEAKTALLGERLIETADGHRATGTSTDAVVVACTGRGPLLPYAGPATMVGWLTGRCVRQALEVALDAYRP